MKIKIKSEISSPYCKALVSLLFIPEKYFQIFELNYSKANHFIKLEKYTEAG
jgi:hypothetical protein